MMALLAQLVIANVFGHLASFMPAVACYEPPGLGVTLLYTDRFTMQASHKCGEASPGFSAKFSLEKIISAFDMLD